MKVVAKGLLASLLLAGIALSSNAFADSSPAQSEELKWALQLFEHYPIHDSSNITYRVANNFEAKLDIYQPLGNEQPRPTVLFFHGGGWAGSTKDTYSFIFLPFLQLGWIVVNIDYRPSSVSLAPAAVEDGLCALRWVGTNAKDYHIDTKQLVLMGQSVGGLIALTTGMIPPAPTGFGGPCIYTDAHGRSHETGNLYPPTVPPMPAAIVNWSGPTDVSDLAQGPHIQAYATAWLGNQPDRMVIARQVSPVSYVRAGLPPIVSIYGDKDTLMPYDQAVRFHDALTKAGTVNKILTIHDGVHGIWGVDRARDAWLQVFDFLEKAGLTLRP